MCCPLCLSQDKRQKYRIYDDRYGYEGIFTLYKCAECGHAFLNCSSNLEKIYTDYYPRSALDKQFEPIVELSSNYKAWLNGDFSSAFRWVPKNGRVLDVGCGFGETLEDHMKRHCKAYGTELDKNTTAVAKAQGLKINIGHFNHRMYERNFFDYITLDQVIEHIKEPIGLLRDLAEVLNEKGRIIISTPNANGWGVYVFGKRWLNWHAPYHLNVFSKKAMKIAAQKAGLHITKIRTVTATSWIYFQFMHLLAYPKKGESSIFWQPGCEWPIGKRIFRYILTVLYSIKVYHAISRAFDLLGIGDNHLYIFAKRQREAQTAQKKQVVVEKSWLHC